MKENIIVLGLPRSGTSLVTNLLVDAGWDGTADDTCEMISADEYNKKGYFELREIIKINSQLIRLINHNCSFLMPYDSSMLVDAKNILNQLPDYHIIQTDYTKEGKWGLQSLVFKKQVIMQKKYMEFKFNTVVKPSWVLKDVRFCLTLPLWDLENYKIVLTLRKPAEIKKSMINHYGQLWSGVSIRYEDYLVPPWQTFEEFHVDYFSCISKCVMGMKMLRVVDFDDLMEGNLEPLEDFVEKKLNKKIIDKSLRTYKIC